MITILLWFCAIGCGLIAGLFFAFSKFVMSALGRIEQSAGVAAMNSINVVIVRSLFMPVFFGTTLTSLALIVFGLLRRGEPGALAMAAGGAVYVLGMFFVTMAFNVPLNNALTRAEPASAESAALWARYLKEWTGWNHVRTIASTAATGLFISALMQIE